MQSYFSLDLETTGLNKDNCQILSIGIVYADKNESDIDKMPKLEMFLYHNQYVFELVAARINAELIDKMSRMTSVIESWNSNLEIDHEELKSKLVHVDTAYRFVHKFLFSNWKEDHQPIFAGKNVASFDIPFLMDLPYMKEVIEPYHRSFDPAMLYYEQGDHGPPSFSTCMKRAGIEFTRQHDAIGDAIDVIKLLRNKGI